MSQLPASLSTAIWMQVEIGSTPQTNTGAVQKVASTRTRPELRKRLLERFSKAVATRSLLPPKGTGACITRRGPIALAFHAVISPKTLTEACSGYKQTISTFISAIVG